VYYASVKESHDDKVIPLHDRADENLHYIRSTIERAGEFSAVPGWGNVAIGVIGLLTAVISSGVEGSGAWLLVWLSAAAVAASVGILTMRAKAHRAGHSVWSRPGQRFAMGLLPSMFAAALLTIPLYRLGMVEFLPAVWLLLFGAGVIAGGMSSVRVLPLMGLCFMTVGVISLLGGNRDVMMAVGFGGVHIVFGYWIARRHGG